MLLQDNVALQIFSICCRDFANFLNKTPVGTIVSQVIIFVNVSNVSFGLQGGAGGDKYWKCQGVIVFCSLTLNVYVNSQETAVLPSFNWMCNHFYLWGLEKIDNLLLLRSKAELVYINKNADRIPRVEFVAHFRWL